MPHCVDLDVASWESRCRSVESSGLFCRKLPRIPPKARYHAVGDSVSLLRQKLNVTASEIRRRSLKVPVQFRRKLDAIPSEAPYHLIGSSMSFRTLGVIRSKNRLFFVRWKTRCRSVKSPVSFWTLGAILPEVRFHSEETLMPFRRSSLQLLYSLGFSPFRNASPPTLGVAPGLSTRTFRLDDVKAASSKYTHRSTLNRLGTYSLSHCLRGAVVAGNDQGWRVRAG